jgi:hypothetical protein
VPKGLICNDILLDTSTVTNRRQNNRIKGSWPVVVWANGGARTAETRDISSQGAFIVCERPLPSKAELRLFIIFHDSQCLELLAEVIWSNPYGSVIDETPCGMGVRFTRISATDRDAISSLAS